MLIKIGRIAGEGGKVKFSIENASRTRIVLADSYVPNPHAGTLDHADRNRNIHILGSVQNIKIARDAIVSLILGSPPGQSLYSPSRDETPGEMIANTLIGKVYAHLKAVGARMKQRF